MENYWKLGKYHKKNHLQFHYRKPNTNSVSILAQSLPLLFSLFVQHGRWFLQFPSKYTSNFISGRSNDFKNSFYHLAPIIIRTDLGGSGQRMLTVVSESLRTRYLHSLKLGLHKIVTNYKGKSNIIVKQPGSCHFIQVINVNITSNGTNEHHMLSDVMPWEEHNNTPVVFLPKVHNPIMRIRQTNPKWKTIQLPSELEPEFFYGWH